MTGPAASVLPITPDQAALQSILGGSRQRLRVRYSSNVESVLLPGFGFVNDQSNTYPLAPFIGSTDREVDWAVLPRGVYEVLADGGSNQLADFTLSELQYSDNTVGLGYTMHATVGPHRGGTELVVVDFDALLAADLNAALDGGAPAVALTRLVPSPRSPVISATLVPPSADGGEYLRDYALTPNGVSYVWADNEVVWHQRPLQLPPGTWLKVWTQSTDRARIGFATGEVDSLPGVEPISEPLPGGAGDFAQLCDRTFAVGARGLFTLDVNPDGGPLGVWSRINALDALTPPAFLGSGASST